MQADCAPTRITVASAGRIESGSRDAQAVPATFIGVGVGAAEFQPPMPSGAVDAGAARRATAIKNLLAALDSADIGYVITHGHNELGENPGSDVDVVIGRRDLARKLPATLAAAAQKNQLMIVQWLRGFPDDAQYIVLADVQDFAAPQFIVLHAAPGAGLCGCKFFSAKRLLPHRQRHGDVFILPPRLEFAAYLARKVAKGKLDLAHCQQLSGLYALDPAGCAATVQGLWNKAHTDQIIAAFEMAAPGSYAALTELLPDLRRALLRRSRLRHPAHAAKCAVLRQYHRARRYSQPQAGLHVVFLGPDGVGKSTVLDRVFEALGPAFPEKAYRTFAPTLVPGGNGSRTPVNHRPQGKPPRSLAASLVKAGWWFTYYTAGYWVTVRRDIARSALSINHRYFMDALVDPKRYRYGGPHWLLKLIWKCSAKPGITLVLDAPADVIQRRKQEVPVEETQRQLDAYRGLLAGLKHGHLLNAAQSVEAVTADAIEIILNYMQRRTARRMGLTPGAKDNA